MKGEGCKVLASQANCNLTSRPPSWKVGEMVKVLHTERGPEHFLCECYNQGVVEIQFGTASAITFSSGCFIKISGSDGVLKVKYCQSGIVATCLLE